jgi:hypothetical protein
MPTDLLGLAVSTSVALLALGCGRNNLGLNGGGSEGGSGGSSIGGSGGPGNGQYGGISGSGGLRAGGVSSAGGTDVMCPPLPCLPNPCLEGNIGLALFDCDCSGPCGCWQCVPRESGAGGTSGSSGTGGAISYGGTSGPSGSGGAISSGGATGKYSGQPPVNHRPSGAPCPSQRGPGPSCATTICASQPYPPGVATTCSSDSQCTAGRNGRCFPFEGLVGPGGCSYDECFSDSNCGERTPCLCRSSSADNSANVCDAGGNCAVDSDCGSGGYCSPSMETCSSAAPEVEVQDNYAGPNPYYCHTASDLCINDSDCASLDAGTATTSSCPIYTPCAYNVQDKRWECTQFSCCPP